MVVDDERFFRELYTDALDRSTDLQIEAFGSAEEALARFDQGGIDAVVSDLVMPGMGGLAFVAALRDRDPDLPLVVVTQREDVRPAVEALRLGVNEYLLKPVDREMLVVAVERAVEDTAVRRDHRRLQAAQAEHLRSEEVYRACLDLLDILDVDQLQDRILATLTRLTGTQGAALWLGDGRGAYALKAFSGVIDQAAVPGALDLDADTALALRLRDQAAHVEQGAALYLPLISGGRILAVALASDKVAGDFTDTDVALARTVGDFAAVALRNALRVTGLQKVGLRDRETAAYNITYFIDYAGKEIYKARRYGRTFSLVTLQVDNLHLLKRTLSNEATRTVHRALVSAVQRVIRDSDILAKVTDDTFYLLLPETDFFGALMFTRRALSAFAAAPGIARLSVPPSVVVGAATYPRDGDDFDDLLQVCRARMDEVRRSPYRRLHLEDEPFWDLVDTLLQTPVSAVEEGTAGRRLAAIPPLFDTILAAAAVELQADPTARGLVYYGAGEVAPELPLLAALDPTREGAARVYLLGRAVEGGLDHPAVTAVPLPDEARLDGHRFLLYLTERAAYAWLEQDDGLAYHTSDATLVEALVARLQEAYDLQRQY